MQPPCGNSSGYNVTQADALSIAQRQFTGKDVDYFLQLDNSQTVWTIFVDAEPMKGWEHECYTLTIPKTITTTVSSAAPSGKVLRSLPPSGNYVPLSVKNRYGNNANSKPVVTKVRISDTDNSAAQRTYAIIVNGYYNRLANYERYWNDCSFIYQTLVNRYGVPKANIYPMMADGNDPEEDMRLSDGTFVSQPLDLDNDGVNEIELAATKANLIGTLNTLKGKLGEDDHLFIFVTDLGGSYIRAPGSYIYLMDDILTPSELAEMLDPFTKKYLNVNVVLGQRYSGGFIDDLTKNGCVVTTACTGDEKSWACSGIPYDEFLYHWTCAVNGADHRGVKVDVDADTDENGRVTMQEAFEYAEAFDSRLAEHPQFLSTPVSVGEDLAFNHIAPAVDLYIMDNTDDTGKEPNLTTDKFWISPSIWIRNEADGKTEHENPYYSSDHVSATVYVRVHNRGKKNYKGGNHYVHAFWAHASTNISSDTWLGLETNSKGKVTGGILTAAQVSPIRSGESGVVAISWALPAQLLGSSILNGSEIHHFCLLAKVLDTHISPALTGTFSYDLRGSNNDAQKNVSIISNTDAGKTTTAVTIGNIDDFRQEYTLEIMPHTKSDEAIFNQARILMEMSEPIFNAWVQGGEQLTDVNRVEGTNLRIFEFQSKDSRIDAISLPAKVSGDVGLRFNFGTGTGIPSYKSKYTFDLIQRDIKGKIIGGETFIIQSPSVSTKQLSITSTPSMNGKTMLSTDVEPDESVRWENEDGAVIGEGASIEVSPRATSDNIYYAYALSKDGELSSGSIKLESELGIAGASMNQQNTVMNIDLKGNAAAGSSIVVSSVSTGDVALSYNLAEGENSVALDVSSLQQGIYAVTYICNGEAIDSVKLSK